MDKLSLLNSFQEEFRSYLKEYEPTKHTEQLERFFAQSALDLEEILTYGLPYLPKIVDAHGNKNLDLLEDYVPQVVGYYEILSRLTFLPDTIRDLCTDLSVYANGQSIELSLDVYNFSPYESIRNVLDK